MANLETTMQRTARHNGSDVAEKMHETKEAISNAAHKAKEAASSMSDKVMHDVKEQSQKMQENLIDYVRREPLKAVGGAVLAGMALSWLLRR